MKTAKIGISIIVFVVIAFFVWNYLAGPLKHRRDIHSFADSVGDCATSKHDIWMSVSGQTLKYTVNGMNDGRCGVRLETPGPHVIRCAFRTEDLPKIAQGFAGTADDIGILGGVTVRVSTSNPDPLTQALNSDACTTAIE
ncbi:MAG: hypothetical protein QNJ07_04960 [Woeseiaceae bacterium]|nr:hypothetical protein [Woeseiaceae bacterium]